jgi:hypothetical protein
MNIQDALPINLRKYTPEQLEAARIAQARRNAICDPDCPACGGIGFISGEGGKIITCPRLFQRQIRKNATRYGLVESEVSALGWKSIIRNKEVDKAMNAVQVVLDRGYGWIFMWGDHGQAKTLLLKIAIAESLRAGKEAAYCNMAGILDNLRAAFDLKDASGESERRLEWWQSLPILAIDEFNRVKESDWVSERRFTLMDARYVQAIRHETITLIASNTSPDKQDSYLYDRIKDGRFEIVELRGPSARASMTEKYTY